MALNRDHIKDFFDVFKIHTSSALWGGLAEVGVKNFIMHTMTAIGAWGGFPDPPLWWNDMMKASHGQHGRTTDNVCPPKCSSF